MEIEGIILKKHLFKENDLVLNILSKSGYKIPMFSFGGAGRSLKKQTGSLNEIGFVHLVNLKKKKQSLDEFIFTTSSSKLIYAHDKIRHSHRQYYLLLVFVELIDKITPETRDEEMIHSDGNESSEIYSLLANAIYYLNNLKPNIELHLFIFLTKLLYINGTFPELNHCVMCDAIFSTDQSCVLNSKEGGFVCSNCDRPNFESTTLRENLRNSIKLSYKELNENEKRNWNEVKLLLDYFLVHSNLNQNQIKSLKFIF